MRLLTASICLAILTAASLRAGDDGLAGNWKFNIYEDGQQISFWLLNFANKDGKWEGTVEPIARGVPRTTLDGLKITGDSLQFTLKIQKGPTFNVEAKLPKTGAKKIFGSLVRENSATPIVMEATAAKNGFEVSRELLLRAPNDPKSFGTLLELIPQGKDNKLAANDLKELVDGSLKASELFGSRWQLQHALKLVDVLQSNEAYAPIALDVARKAEKMLDAKAPIDTQLKLLSLVSDALRKAKQDDEAKKLDIRVNALENAAFAEHNKKKAPFELEKPAPRKGNRAVLVELFTGAQCPPCVAADMAFDGLEKTYPAADVVLLQYHMHIPAPEPMSSPDSEKRFDAYSDRFPKAVRGTPAMLFNGKVEGAFGGGPDEAEDTYKSVLKVVGKQLEKPATVHLSASATRKDDKIRIKAQVKDLDKPGEKIKLRFVLVEDWVRYKGRNGLQYHHRVVRALPGGVEGFAVTKKDADQNVTVDLADVRKAINTYLDESYPEGPRPLRLRSLHVVALVQDDATGEVLQAIDTPVRDE